ncbi:MAG TPA: potassium channel family protein [Candidatus Acidoferrum sp.]|nr:potassium channel family protein [Candidatus Acidoferrum sp.]
MADWIEAGEPTDGVGETASEPAADTAPLIGPPLTVSPTGEFGRVPARVSQMGRLDESLLEMVHQRSTLQLFLLWIGMILVSGACYWLGALIGKQGLVEGGIPVGADLKGFVGALYFSFVTATSIGYGDIVPIGGARAIAVIEAISALLIFGAVVAKFVSHRQDQLVSEIHRITFEERLDRVQTNLHMVISELLAIAAMCEAPDSRINRYVTRLESAMMLFQGELRTTHDLLYQPRLIVEEGVLAAILAALSSAMNVFSDVLACLPPNFARSQPFEITLQSITRLAEEICGECVPHSYTPRLVFWMDRIKATAQRIK